MPSFGGLRDHFSSGRDGPAGPGPTPANMDPSHFEIQDPPPTITRSSDKSALQLTPYLGLQARLSQVWINRWTILLLLVLVRTLIAISGLNNDLGSARREALSACNGVETMASSMASMPHYMSKGVNELAASGVEKAVNGLMSMLLISVTGVEEIAVFIINLLTSTYLCLITLAVSGSLHVALQVVDDTKDFLNKTLGSIGDDIHKSVDSFQADVNKFSNMFNSVPKILGSDDKIPQLNINGSLDKLDNLQLPGTLNQGLDQLNKSIPDFKDVQNFTDNLIRLPFEDIKKLINGSLHTYEFNRSMLPVPAKEQLSFCSDNHGINDFFDGLVKTAKTAKTVALVVLLLLAILVCVPMAYREVWRYRHTQQRAQLLQQQAFDPMDVVQIASRPYTSTLGIKVASKFSSTRRQILVRWFVAYATTTPALFVLALGLAGLFSCLCQYILLKAVEKEAPNLAAEVGQFADRVVNTLNNASAQWATDTNKVIDGTNNDINHDVFGWVNTSTSAVNNTLNEFVDHMSDALNKTFGGTVLYDPIKEVLNCLIGLKIEGVQKGLTWVHDHAHIDFPNLPNDTFTLGAAESLTSNNKSDSFLANPGSETTDEITNVVVSMTNRLAHGIQTEAIISLCVLLVWVIVVIVGLVRTIIMFMGNDKTRAEGGPDYPMSDNPMHGGRNGTAFPFTGTTGPGTSRAAGGMHPDEFDPPPAFEYHQHDKDLAAQTAQSRQSTAVDSVKFGEAGLRNDMEITLAPGNHTRKSNYGYVDEKGI